MSYYNMYSVHGETKIPNCDWLNWFLRWLKLSKIYICVINLLVFHNTEVTAYVISAILLNDFLFFLLTLEICNKQSLHLQTK